MGKRNKKSNQKRDEVATSSKRATDNKQSKRVSNKEQNKEQQRKEEENLKVTWEDIAAMSDSDDDDDDDIGVAVDLNAKAKSLRQAIQEGKFDSLLKGKKGTSGNSKDEDDDDDDDDDFEEDVLEGSSVSSASSSGSNGDVDAAEPVEGAESKGASHQENQASDEEGDPESPSDQEDNDDDDDEDNQDENDEEEEEEGDDASGTSKDANEVDDAVKEENYLVQKMKASNQNNTKALALVTAELAATHSKLPWAETFVVVPPTPLPFGEHGDLESNPLDVHDDLKREVAFYNVALEAVHQARKKCNEANIPFSRPEDFFAEMVKTDDHMAKIKDRLIFENKKIEAVAQRKSNKEQKLRARESQANRLAEKAKKKKQHFQQVQDWANSAANQRGSALQDDMDQQFLAGTNRKGPNKKRQAADRKFGFGGKRGRFKQNDKQTLNDMSGFNHKGNFAGGMKRTHASSKNGNGAHRPGKRARDTKRARR